MTKSQGLGFILIVGALVLVTRWALVDEFPPLPLNEPLPLEQDSTWIKMFGDDPPSVEMQATLTYLGGDDVRITSPYRLVDGVSELIFADEAGQFSASWC